VADIHQPHNRHFRAVFSDPKETARLLQATLPGVIRDSLDWTTLTLLDGTFVDEDLQEGRSALLCQVKHIETGQAASQGLCRVGN